jgi:hypothetical protein
MLNQVYPSREIVAQVDRLVEQRLAAAVDHAVERRMTAAAPTRIIEIPAAASVPAEVELKAASAGAGSDSDMEWRRLSGNSNRVLPIAAWARQVEVCYWLWKTNPLGNWIIETLTALVTGNGYSVTAKNEELHEFIKSFWTDAVNNLDLKLEGKVRECSIFGLQVWPVFKAEQTGRVRLGMLDPAQVINIYSDPQNAELLIGVKIANLHTGEPRFLKTIIGTDDETVMSEDARSMRDGFQDGECFLVSINRVSNDPFGTSDIFVVADWLDEYEEFLYSYSGKARKQNAYIWDVTIEGGTDQECEQFAQEYPSQSDGSVRVHNQRVKWDAVAPKLNALEMKETIREFRNHILGAKNIPEHWYGGGGNVNRATAGESNDAILAWIGKRQQFWKQVLKLVIDYAIKSAFDAGYLMGIPADELFAYEIQVPEATNKDITKLSAAIQQIVASMVMAASQGWLDDQNAIKLFGFIIEMIGFAIDQESVLENDPAGKDYPREGKSGPKLPAAPSPEKTPQGSEGG